MPMGRRGIALILTLWVMVLMSVVALNFARSSRLTSAVTRNLKDETSAFYRAESAMEEAAAYLMSDPDLQMDFVDGEGLFHTDVQREPVGGTIETAGGSVQLTITDEESRININHAGRDVLMNLLKHTGASEEDIPKVLDTIADWKDPDDLHHLQGAEDDYYEPLGYLARNHEFESPGELVYVKGITPGMLAGDDDNKGIAALLTTLGKLVNVNTASATVLELIGMDSIELQSILDMRESYSGLRSVPPSMAGKGTTFSTHIRVIARAPQPESGQTVKLTAIFERKKSPEGTELKTIYWKEELEYSGT